MAGVGGGHRAEFVVAAGVFVLCAGVSLWANVSTAAEVGGVAGRAVAGWPVVAVLVAEVLVLWVPGVGWRFRARQLLAGCLGVLALAMSYSHMRTKAESVGLEGWEADWWPATVDGLLVLAGLALHELWPLVRGSGGNPRRSKSKRSVSAKPPVPAGARAATSKPGSGGSVKPASGGSRAGKVSGVERTLQEQTGIGAVFETTKSTAGDRIVKMPKQLATRVESHLNRRCGENPDSLVFTNTAGRPIRATVWSIVEQRAETVAQRIDELLDNEDFSPDRAVDGQ